MAVVVGSDAPDRLLYKTFTVRARRGDWDPRKQQQRELIGNFIASNTPEGWTPTLLTVAGISTPTKETS